MCNEGSHSGTVEVLPVCNVNGDGHDRLACRGKLNQQGFKNGSVSIQNYRYLYPF